MIKTEIAVDTSTAVLAIATVMYELSKLVEVELVVVSLMMIDGLKKDCYFLYFLKETVRERSPEIKGLITVIYPATELSVRSGHSVFAPLYCDSCIDDFTIRKPIVLTLMLRQNEPIQRSLEST